MKKQKFYITTPIYYGNGIPHIGHFYTSMITDVIHRYKKISGYETKFTTGIDENSQKAVIKAEEVGKDVMQYLDEMAEIHKSVWDFFAIDYGDFIRTTSSRHKKMVQEVLQACFDRGDIYEGEYEGKYCIGCEAFKKDDDLIPHPHPLPGEEGIKVCPDHLTEPDLIKEKNYFFKLSKYQTWLEEFYEENPSFIDPDFRFNEVKAFVERGLEDFSISRETNTFGIPLPFDESQVTYVWFDALFNYYTSCKYSPKHSQEGEENFEDKSDFWIGTPEKRNILHVVGKDIIRFHGIYWPAMLASYFGLGEEKNGVIHFSELDKNYLPTQILVNGFFTVDGQKMSKSLGNVIEPIEYSKKYNKDMLVLYMLSAFSIGRDGDYDRKDAILNYNAKLANNFGNLLNRGVVLTKKLERENGLLSSIDEKISKKGAEYENNFSLSMKNYDLKSALDTTFFFLDELNLYMTEKEPWKMMKNENLEKETQQVLYTVLESLRQIGLNMYSFFPEKMGQLFLSLGLENYREKLEKGALDELKNKKEIFDIQKKADILFQKFELEDKN